MNKRIKRNSLKKIFSKSKIVCLTAYTAPIAKIADKCADIILVGDSVGPVLYGHKTTRNVDMDMIIRHAKSVVKNTKEAFIVVDMPFGTYETSKHKALENARKIISSSGAMAVKLEGGEKVADTIEFLTQNKIKVMGHLGMLPQSITGRPKVYGKSEKEKKQIFKDISVLKKVGVFSVVVECTLKKVVDELIKASDLPIIGIGASECCRGQIIVTEDILGMTELKTKFSKKYLDFFPLAEQAVNKFSLEVTNGKYPKKNQCS